MTTATAIPAPEADPKYTFSFTSIAEIINGTDIEHNVNLAAYKYLVCYAVLCYSCPSLQLYVFCVCVCVRVYVCSTVDIVVSGTDLMPTSISFNDIHTFLIYFLHSRVSPGQYAYACVIAYWACIYICINSVLLSSKYVPLIHA